MSIKSQGGVFGRNPTFNDVTVEGDLSIAGTLSVGGETITGLSYQGGWNASTNTPDIAASSPVTGQFWIVSADGSTNVGGITNWTSGDWALYDGTNWQRVEGGNTDLSTGVQGQLAISNGGTGAADAATARTNLGLGTAATTASTDYATAAQGTTADSALQPADIGSTVQGYDVDTAKYDDTTANFTGTLQNGGSNVIVDSDIGSTVQAYDADTAKLDVTQNWTAQQNFGTTTTVTGDFNISGGYQTITNSGSNDARLSFMSTGGNSGWIGIPSWDVDSLRIYGPYGSGSEQIANYNGDISRGWTFKTSSSADVKIDSSGNILLNSGSGIDFSATSGTGTSELLDDYEEGTWTPTFANVATPTMTSSGSYTKIGRLVYCTADYSVTSLDNTDPSGIAISGLPYNAAGNMPSVFFLGQRFNLLSTKASTTIGAATLTNALFLYEASNNNITYSEMASSGDLEFSFMYYT